MHLPKVHDKRVGPKEGEPLVVEELLRRGREPEPCLHDGAAQAELSRVAVVEGEVAHGQDEDECAEGVDERG